MFDGINQSRPWRDLIYTPLQVRMLWGLCIKKGNVRALWEVNHKQKIMKSNPNPKNETAKIKLKRPACRRQGKRSGYNK